ncbi:MAG: nucleotidyltransferase domain-containing protein [Candidatus Aenigmatarchaeota archaeon]
MAAGENNQRGAEVAEKKTEQKREEKAKTMGEKLRKFSLRTRLKSSDEFKNKILGMFKDYIKAVVVWGSITRGDYTGKSDVDIYIIFDDTKMPLKKFDDIREKVDRDIARMASETDPRLHPQPVLALTEFMDGVMKQHPLFYNIVREGYAIHDTGYFIPMRKMLEWGKFPATIEAAETRMEGVPKRLRRVESVKLYMIAEDLYYAIVDAAQAVLMFVGVGPPAPKVIGKQMRAHLVAPGLLEEEWADFVDEVVKFRKAVEHKEIRQIKGEEVDKWIARTEKFVERIERLLANLEAGKKASDIKKMYEIMIKASVAALKSLEKLPPEPEKLPEAFRKYLTEPGLVSPWYADVFGKVVEMRKKLEDKKLEEINDRDVYMTKEYVRRFVMDVRGIIEKSRPAEKELEKAAKEMEKKEARKGGGKKAKK